MDLLSECQVLVLHGLKKPRLQVRNDRSTAREQPLASEHQRRKKPGTVRAEHVHRPAATVQRANLPVGQLRTATPVLDGGNRGHLIAHAQQGGQGVALPPGRVVLEGDQRQVGHVGDALEVFDRHLGSLSESGDARGKHEQSRGAPRIGHARQALRLQAAVGVDPIDDGQALAHLVLRDGQHPLLLFEGAGSGLGGMGVDGQRADASHAGDIAQMGAKTRLIDAEVFKKRQQYSGNDAVRNVRVSSGHGGKEWNEPEITNEQVG